MSFACSSPAGGMVFGVSGLLLLLLFISFNEDHINYENRYINFVGICPKTAPSQGYSICKYVNWIGIHGRIGDKNNHRKHSHIYLSKAQFWNGGGVL